MRAGAALVQRCAAATCLLFTALAPAASYSPCAFAPVLGGLAARGLCGAWGGQGPWPRGCAGHPRRPVMQRSATATMGIFGFGSDGGDKDGEGENWLRVLRLQALLRAAVEQEKYQGAARLHTEIHQLLAKETDALARALSAAAADAKRNMKRLRRRGDRQPTARLPVLSRGRPSVRTGSAPRPAW